MKIAAAQISCTLGDCAANLRKVRDFSARAKKSGAELIVFPEMTDTGYSMPAIQKHAAAWNEGAVPHLQKIAREFRVAMACGVSEREGERISNAQVIVDPNGEILAKYRRTHLVTAAPLDERPIFTAGDKLVSCKIDDFTAGLAICYDLRFPEASRKLAVEQNTDRKSTRLNSSHSQISYAVFCLKKKNKLPCRRLRRSGRVGASLS